MKKLTTILAAVALVISSSAFASSGVNVTEKVNKAFQTSFTGASNVTWTKTDQFYFAHFVLNNDEVSVAYNEDGELLGTSQIIDKSALPQAITYSLKDQYGDFAVSSSVNKIELTDKVVYFITLSNKTNSLRVKSSEEGILAVEKKTKNPVRVGRVY
ncbi:MAG: hypothetical protein QM737_10885 [Ferruginibacter sp.]